MDRISFDIFEPEKKRFHVTPNLVVYSFWGFLILFLWALGGVVPVGSTVRNMSIGVVFLVNMFFLITSFFRFEPLRGRMNGKIIFNEDEMVIGSHAFKLKEIKNIDFHFGDFYGSRSLAIRGNFNPMLSQGVNNFISFDDKSGETKLVYFRMMTNHSSLTLHPFINTAVKTGAMSYYRAIDLIDVENVTKP